MEKLKYTEELIREVDYHELEEFIVSVYGVEEYSAVASEEWSNDSNNGAWAEKGELDEYENKKLEKFKNNENPSYILNVILKDLCNKGLVDEGKYMVSVCW